MSHQTTLDTPLLHLGKEELLTSMFRYCTENSYTLAIWHEPGHSQIQGVIDFDRTELTDDMPGGFLFGPYNRHHPCHLIRAQIYFQLGEHFNVTSQGYVSPEKFIESIKKYAHSPIKKPAILEEINEPVEKESYEKLVEKAVNAIKKGEFLKVVPSRSKSFRILNFSVARQFLAMQRMYPSAFVSATYTPEHGIWMGASPELLVEVRDNRYFETIALAGTQRNDTDISTGDVTWTQKEIEEQALVSRYIINCFKKIRLRDFEELGPKTVAAGNLIHLKTRFLVDMDKTGFPELGSVMLELLHPTSAICGMPLDKAEAWLSENEKYDRRFFGGYLGPVNLNNKTSLYVNLRCMKVEDERIIKNGWKQK